MCRPNSSNSSNGRDNLRSSGPGVVNHRNVSIISIVETIRRDERENGFARYLPADLWGRTPLSYHRPRAAISLSRYEPAKSFKARNYTYKLRGGGGGGGFKRFRFVAKTEAREARYYIVRKDNKCQPLFAQMLRSFSREGRYRRMGARR